MKKKQNYVFPIKSIAKINFLFLILTSILALPKFINNSIPFNGYNFNDFFTLPLAFYLLLCFIKEKEEEYNYLENETKLSSWLPFICSILLQLAFYYIQYFDSITKGFTPQHTYAQNCHILHLTILLYFFIAVCAYFLIFFKFIEIKNKESKINNPIYSFKDTLIFVLLYIYIIIWSYTNFIKNALDSEGIVIITLAIFVFVHVLVLVQTNKVNGFKGKHLKNANIGIIALSLFLYAGFQIVIHYDFFKKYLSYIICSFILLMIFILILLAFSKTNETTNIEN